MFPLETQERNTLITKHKSLILQTFRIPRAAGRRPKVKNKAESNLVYANLNASFVPLGELSNAVNAVVVYRHGPKPRERA